MKQKYDMKITISNVPRARDITILEYVFTPTNSKRERDTIIDKRKNRGD